MSIRQLAQQLQIPRSTLGSYLKRLVEENIVTEKRFAGVIKIMNQELKALQVFSLEDIVKDQGNYSGQNFLGTLEEPESMRSFVHDQRSHQNFCLSG